MIFRRRAVVQGVTGKVQEEVRRGIAEFPFELMDGMI
jgi:hypothetical protein